MPKTKAAPSSKKPLKAKTSAAATPPSSAHPRLSLQEVMAALEKAGSAQTRKTYARHGATGEMFGVSFGDLKKLVDRIKVDQELAEALWDTGNFDARNLAGKVCDPATISPKVLDAWAAAPVAWVWGGYVGQIAAEGPHGRAKAEKWLAAKVPPHDATRSAGWCTVSAMAMIDETTPDDWFADRLAEIEKGMKTATNRHRYLMNNALIAIGCRSAALCKLAMAAAKRLGKIEVDHGDTACKTPDAVERLEKCWAYAKSKGFKSPAEQERSRESMRTRC